MLKFLDSVVNVFFFICVNWLERSCSFNLILKYVFVRIKVIVIKYFIIYISRRIVSNVIFKLGNN